MLRYCLLSNSVSKTASCFPLVSVKSKSDAIAVLKFVKFNKEENNHSYHHNKSFILPIT